MWAGGMNDECVFHEHESARNQVDCAWKRKLHLQFSVKRTWQQDDSSFYFGVLT